MPSRTDLIKKLTTLNQIADTLNRSVDVKNALQGALSQLVELMELETGWILLKDPSSKNRWGGRGYSLVAHHNLPPAMAPDKARAWKGDCECERLCNNNALDRSYNEIHCTRLSRAGGNRAGLMVHASTPLCSGDRVLGILNVAARNWSAFSQEALALLTNAGSQMGIALERAQLFDMLKERRIHEQAALLDLSSQLLSQLNLDDLMAHLAKEIQRLMEADACALVLPDPESGLLAFRATSGWQVDPTTCGRGAPADEVSGPGWVMRTQRPLLVEDVQREDPAPWMPTWLQREGFRGHAVMPLIADGASIGTLIVDTRQPRKWDEDQARFLQLLTNQAAIAIERVRLHEEALKRQRMEEELSLAQQIQLSLLPKALPVAQGWEFAAFYRPARQVGGDFYDFFSLPGKSKQWGILIADVADKGVPSALYMALCRTLIRSNALSGRSPASTLMRANKLILADSQSDLFLTAFYAKLDTDSGRLIYSNAGHNWPLWWRAADGTFKELSTRGIILGAFENIELEEKRIDVAPGDVLVFYTDGVTEAINHQVQEFGMPKLREVIAAHATASASQVLKSILTAVDTFAGEAPPFDDLTMVVVKRTPLPD
jgi:serine phosphatase RsbU (regulator of sigma subunit)